MLVRHRTPRIRSRRRPAALLLALWLASALAPQAVAAAAPDVREVTPAEIVIDGSVADWDTLGLDFLTDMFEAGKPEMDILAKAYGRYDCGTQTFYILVVTVPGWKILPSNADNYVKLGQTATLVNGNSGADGTPPDFRYAGATAWEASFNLPPGSYLGDGGLNIHAEVVPDNRASTAAPIGRRMDAIIDCTTPPPTPTPTPPLTPSPTPTPPPTPSSTPTPPPTPSPTPTPPPTPSPTPTPTGPDPTPTPTPTPDPTPSPTPTPPPTPSPTPTPGPTPSPTPTPPPTPSPTPTPGPTQTSVPTPTGSVLPIVDPPIIVAKVNDQGTSATSDDRIVGGATFAFRRDDGDGAYEPTVDDAPVLASVEATHGFAVFAPPGGGDYWVTETSAPTGLDAAPPQLVTYTLSTTPQNCGFLRGRTQCRADDDATGGYLIVVVTDSPLGGVAPTLPRTDTGALGDEPQAPGGVWLVIAGLLSLSAALLLVTTRWSPGRQRLPVAARRRSGRSFGRRRPRP